jgi:hypothetical protein
MSEIGIINSDSVAHSSGAGFGRVNLNTDRHRYSIDRPFKCSTSSVKGKDRLDSDNDSPVIGNDWSETDNVNSDSNITVQTRVTAFQAQYMEMLD